jgi:hypothetical protein
MEGWKASNLLVSVEKFYLSTIIDVRSLYRNQKSGCLSPFRLRMERDPISETLCSLEYQMINSIKKFSNPNCYILSSEPFRIERNSPFGDLFFHLKKSRSQWPRSLRHELFRPLEHWDRGFESHLRHGCL